MASAAELRKTEPPQTDPTSQTSVDDSEVASKAELVTKSSDRASEKQPVRIGPVLNQAEEQEEAEADDKEEGIEEEPLAPPFARASKKGEEVDLLIGQGKGVRHTAAALFHCTVRQVRQFDTRDPFSGNRLQGFISRKEGLMGGSLYITHVNGKIVRPQLIYGVPKQAYPYTTKKGLSKEKNHTWMRFRGPITHYYLGNKWNGTNILFFKYFNAQGRLFISVKTKGSATVNDCQFGAFLTDTRKTLGIDTEKPVNLVIARPPLLVPLIDDPTMQSISFELCGSDQAHLVKYNFKLALKPLFHTYNDGSIEPHIYGDPSVDRGPFEYKWEECVSRCQRLQKEFLRMNEEWRGTHNMKHRYEHDHFITEGCVLYPLDSNNRTIGRTMFKVKPEDVEEVHWAQFDEFRKGQVRDALTKIVQRNKPLTAESLRTELDMGPKEWSKFGHSIMRFAKQTGPTEQRSTPKKHRSRNRKRK